MTLHIETKSGTVVIKRGDEHLFIAPASATHTQEELKQVQDLAWKFVTVHNTLYGDMSLCCGTCGHTLHKGKCPICKLDPKNWSEKKSRKRANKVETRIIQSRGSIPSTPKIHRIKIAKNLFNLGLRETKDWVEVAYCDNGQGAIK